MTEETRNDAPVPVDEATVAANFLQAELEAARDTLRNTQIVGSIIVALLGGYVIYAGSGLNGLLQPAKAVDFAIGEMGNRIDANRDAVVQEVSVRVPEMIQRAPDYAMEQMPIMRVALEEKFEDELTKYTKATSVKFGEQLDAYIIKNKDAIKGVLEIGADEEAVAVLGDTIRDEVKLYLEQKPEGGGESAGEQISESAKLLTDAAARLHRLASASDLTPAEKQSRHAIAVIANTIDAQDLPQISLPQLGTEEEKAAEPVAP